MNRKFGGSLYGFLRARERESRKKEEGRRRPDMRERKRKKTVK